MNSHFITLQNKKKANEDRYTINDSGSTKYYAIYDGHGGVFVADYLTDNLTQFFIDNKVSYPLSKDYVNMIYDKIQSILCDKFGDNVLYCGSTSLSLCQYAKDKINIVNVGDSRAVLCRHRTAMQLTMDHKPENPYEHSRVVKNGGSVYFDGEDFRIDDLGVARSFGDKYTDFVIHEPDIFDYKIEKQDRFIILACDGLWDVLTNQQAVDIVLNNIYQDRTIRIKDEKNSADLLANEAIKLGSIDNITCIIIFFD